MSFENFYKRKVEGGEAVTPFDFDRMPEQKPAAEEIKQDGQKLQQRTNWWQVPTYTDAVEMQRKAAMQAAEKDVNRAKRERDAAMITDMADVLTRFFATRGADGAWMLPQQENRSAAANEAYNNALRRKDGLAVDFGGKIAHAKMQDFQNRQRQLQSDREYALAVDKAKRDEQQQLANLMLKQAEFALSKAKTEDEQKRAWAKLDNDMKIAGMNNSTRRWVQEEITKRAKMRGYGKDSIKEIDLKNGEFIEVDKQKWSTANKEAIADKVKEAIINELKPEDKDAFLKKGWLPIETQLKYGFTTAADMTTNKLFEKWRDFDESKEYVKKFYGVNNANNNEVSPFREEEEENVGW